MCSWRWTELECCDYQKALELQEKIKAERIQNQCPNTALMLEHFPVFTLGNRGGKEFLHVPEDILQKQNISIIPTRRGGYITYHAPGQLVVYPILSLPEMNMGVAQYVSCLEEVMIHVCHANGIFVHRNPNRPGVWLQSKKVGSIGISVSRGVTSHGFALNVNLDITPFTWIAPCGFSDISVTSLAIEAKKEIDMADIRTIAKEAISTVFNVSLQAR